MRTKRALAALAAATVALLPLFATTAWVEARIFLRSSDSMRSEFDALSAGAVEGGISPYSQRYLLDDCLDAMLNVYGRLQPPERRRALNEQCTRQALRYVAWTPTFSYAWYVAARAAIDMGDRAAFEAYMRRSYMTAPSEGWVAALRVQLSDEYRDALSADLLGSLHGDIGLLLGTDAGANALAARMVSQPAFHEEVLAIAEKMPLPVQQRLFKAMQVALERNAVRR